jgi:hypothetical protein
MQTVEFNGWRNSVRLANREVELIATRDVGPRIARFGFVGQQNVMAEIPGQQGGSGESEWMIRGGHRLWIAPEEKPKTYEPDNAAIAVEEIRHGIRTLQPKGSLSGVSKTMKITLKPGANEVRIVHGLKNETDAPIRLSPWALTVMAPGGMAVIPLPAKIPHTDRLTHNQSWSIWSYTDMADPRWSFGSRYVLFRQDATRGPNKLGIAHREGWIGYLLGEFLFVKRFAWKEGAAYPDGGVNFETFSNHQMLELESLGPLKKLGPGKTVTHEERWSLFRGVPPCRSEDDIDRNVLPRIRSALCS